MCAVNIVSLNQGAALSAAQQREKEDQNLPSPFTNCWAGVFTCVVSQTHIYKWTHLTLIVLDDKQMRP